MASIQKRINKDITISYRIKVSNGLKANGKPNIVSKTWKPKNNMTQSQINKELNKICIQFEEEVKKGLLIDENVLFSTYSYDWLENKKNGIANKTYVEYKRIVDRLIEEFGNYKITQIKSSMVSKYFNKLRQNGANKNTGGPLTENTIKHYYIVINDILECACDVNIIHRNPLSEKAFIKPKPKKKEVQILQENNLVEFLDYLENENIKPKTILYLLLYSGMRIGEITALEWTDIDIANKTITINKSHQRVSGLGIMEKGPKTEKSNREICVPQICIDYLLEYKKYQDNDISNLKNLWHKTITLYDENLKPFKKANKKIFTQEYGLPMAPEYVSKWVKNFCKRTKMEFTPHTLRHTFVSLLVQQKLPINLVSETVGHSSSTTTLAVYTHLFKKDKIKTSIAIDDAINNIKNKTQD